MEWQWNKHTVQPPKVLLLKKTKFIWMLKFMNASLKKKKSVPLSSIYLSMQLSTALFLHQQGELQVFKQLRRLCLY